MTTQAIRLKIVRVSQLKLKVAPLFPVIVIGGAGINITKSGLTYTFAWNPNAFNPVSSITDANESATYLPLQFSVDGSFSKISITDFKADIQATFGGYYQPLDATLTALAGVSTSANQLIYASGADAFNTTNFTSLGRSLVGGSTTGAMQTTLALVIGTNVQAWDADLDALAAISAAQGSVIYKGASAWTSLGPGTSGQLLSSGGAAANPSWITASGTGTVTSIGITAGAGIAVSGSPVTSSGSITVTADPVYLRGYLSGLTISAAGSTATFGIAAGVACSSAQANMMSLGSAYTKTTSAWAVGSASGSIDTGSIANNTWYHVHLIKRTDTNVVDVLISLSATAPTLPTNYTVFRRIGAMKTDGSAQWKAFLQHGKEFMWLTAVADQSVTNLSTTSTDYALASVPSGVAVQAIIDVQMFNANIDTYVYVREKALTDVAPAFASAPITVAEVTAASHGGYAPGYRVWTDTSQTISARSNGASTHLALITRGWIDTLGT